MNRTTPKCWEKKGWVDVCSDLSWEDYGGMWGKRAERSTMSRSLRRALNAAVKAG